MFGYESTVLFMVGKAIDAEKLATAKRERDLNEGSRVRRLSRRKRSAMADPA
jgi:hypothetical protein